MRGCTEMPRKMAYSKSPRIRTYFFESQAEIGTKTIIIIIIGTKTKTISKLFQRY